MYDKYFTTTPFAINGTRLPKHKGIMLTNTGTIAGATATFQFFQTGGATTNVIIPTLQNTMQIIPIQAFSASSMAAGVTGWLIS